MKYLDIYLFDIGGCIMVFALNPWLRLNFWLELTAIGLLLNIIGFIMITNHWDKERR